MAITASSGAMDSSPSSMSLNGLDGINFFLAGMQSGFGPFVAVLLADEKWSQQNIGFVLTVGGVAGLLSQLPGGELLDASRSKRLPGRTGRGYGLGQRFRDRTLAKPSGGLCCLGAARADRRVPWAGYRSDQPWLSRPLRSCRTALTQSKLRLRRSPGDHRGDGRDRLFSFFSSNISPLRFPRASVAF